MKKEELVEMFCSKVNLEQKRYKKRIIKINPEEIYNRSYEIDCMVNISEVLLEKCESMSEDVLKCLLVLPSLLHFFYSRWMKTGDVWILARLPEEYIIAGEHITPYILLASTSFDN